MNPIRLKGNTHNLMVGEGYPIIVNCNIGANDLHNFSYEKNKIDTLFKNPLTSPDTMMDLSILDKEGHLARHIIQKHGVPVGVVPIYAFNESELNKSSLLKQIKNYAEMGIAFMSMHFTADTDIYEIAVRERKIPTTSRGGSISLKNAYKSGKLNIFRKCINDIIELANKYNFVISLGTTFRPASIIDACDNAHLTETIRQIELSHYLQEQGVSVIVENVGHISIDKIEKHSSLLQQCNAPIMPLGPSVLDSAIGYDHIAASIGASFMAYNNVAHIINAISPTEHQRSFFSKEDAKTAIIAAKIAAKSVNVAKFKISIEEEEKIYNIRAEKHSCITTKKTICERCNKFCPLNLNIHEK